MSPENQSKSMYGERRPTIKAGTSITRNDLLRVLANPFPFFEGTTIEPDKNLIWDNLGRTNGEPEEALVGVRQLTKEGWEPSVFTFSAAIPSNTAIEALRRLLGKKEPRFVISREAGFDSVVSLLEKEANKTAV